MVRLVAVSAFVYWIAFVVYSTVAEWVDVVAVAVALD